MNNFEKYYQKAKEFYLKGESNADEFSLNNRKMLENMIAHLLISRANYTPEQIEEIKTSKNLGLFELINLLQKHKIVSDESIRNYHIIREYGNRNVHDPLFEPNPFNQKQHDEIMRLVDKEYEAYIADYGGYGASEEAVQRINRIRKQKDEALAWRNKRDRKLAIHVIILTIVMIYGWLALAGAVFHNTKVLSFLGLYTPDYHNSPSKNEQKQTEETTREDLTPKEESVVYQTEHIDQTDTVISTDQESPSIDFNNPETIKQIQTLLHVAGYENVSADGSAGPITQNAIQDYRLHAGLPEGNLIDQELLDSLTVYTDSLNDTTQEEATVAEEINQEVSDGNLINDDLRRYNAGVMRKKFELHIGEMVKPDETIWDGFRVDVSDNSVVSVDDAGVIKAIAEGECTVTYSAGGLYTVSNTYTITVIK